MILITGGHSEQEIESRNDCWKLRAQSRRPGVQESKGWAEPELATAQEPGGSICTLTKLPRKICVLGSWICALESQLIAGVLWVPLRVSRQAWLSRLREAADKPDNGGECLQESSGA